MNEIQTLQELQRRRKRITERKAELWALVSNPKPIEYKAAVVQTSTPGGNELIDYVIKAGELEAQAEELTQEIRAIEERISQHFDKLTERERKVIVLRFFQEERWPIIARAIYGEITKDNITNAMKIRRRAERKLDTFLR